MYIIYEALLYYFRQESDCRQHHASAGRQRRLYGHDIGDLHEADTCRKLVYEGQSAQRFFSVRLFSRFTARYRVIFQADFAFNRDVSDANAVFFHGSRGGKRAAHAPSGENHVFFLDDADIYRAWFSHRVLF